MEILIPVVVCVLLAYFFMKFISEKPKQQQDKTSFVKENTPEQPKLKMYSSPLNIKEAQNIVMNKIESVIDKLNTFEKRLEFFMEEIKNEKIESILNPIAKGIYEMGMVNMENRKLGEEYLKLSGYVKMQNDFFMTDFISKVTTKFFDNIRKNELQIYVLEHIIRITRQTIDYDNMFKTGNVKPILNFITEVLKKNINNYSSDSIYKDLELNRISFDLYSIGLVKLNNEILGKELLKKMNYIELQRSRFIKDFEQKMSVHYFDNMNDLDIYNYLNDYTAEIAKTTLLLEEITTTSDKRFEYYN